MRNNFVLVPTQESVSDVFRYRVEVVLKNDNMKKIQLAEKLGISSSQLSMGLKSSRTSLQFAVNVAKALDVSMDWLCGLDDGQRD